MSRHTDLVDKVNVAKTQYEHDLAKAYLEGWREGVSNWSDVEANEHTRSVFGCCRPVRDGILLDWQPFDPVA